MKRLLWLAILFCRTLCPGEPDPLCDRDSSLDDQAVLTKDNKVLCSLQISSILNDFHTFWHRFHRSIQATSCGGYIKRWRDYPWGVVVHDLTGDDSTGRSNVIPTIFYFRNPVTVLWSSCCHAFQASPWLLSVMWCCISCPTIIVHGWQR